MSEAMTALDITKAIFGRQKESLWDAKHVIGAPMALVALGWEADLVLLQKSGLVYEVEIKVSKSDFKRELQHKKWKHEQLRRGLPASNANPTVSRFYFAMPQDLATEVHLDVPHWAGIISVSKQLDGSNIALVRRPAHVLSDRKVTDAQKMTILKAAHDFLWNSKSKGWMSDE